MWTRTSTWPRAPPTASKPAPAAAEAQRRSGRWPRRRPLPAPVPSSAFAAAPTARALEPGALRDRGLAARVPAPRSRRRRPSAGVEIGIRIVKPRAHRGGRTHRHGHRSAGCGSRIRATSPSGTRSSFAPSAPGTTGSIKLVRSSYNRILGNIARRRQRQHGARRCGRPQPDRGQHVHAADGTACLSVRCSSFNVFRGNTFSNERQKAIEIYDCEGVGSDNPVRDDATKRNLFERNQVILTRGASTARPPLQRHPARRPAHHRAAERVPHTMPAAASTTRSTPAKRAMCMATGCTTTRSTPIAATPSSATSGRRSTAINRSRTTCSTGTSAAATRTSRSASRINARWP